MSGIGQVCRHRCPVEIRTEAHVVHPRQLDNMIDVRDHVIESYVLWSLCTRAKKTDMEVNSYESAFLGKCKDLLVAEIPCNWTQRAAIAMARHNRLLRVLEHIPEARII